jgi:hypothetical protein
MNEVQVRDGLFELFPPEGNSDWDDVLRRADRPRRHLSRLSLVVAVALLLLLAIGSALALSGRLGGLLHGTPVNDLTPRERFLMSELDMNGKVELIARRNSTAFYVIRRKDGRRCYSIGDVRAHLTPAQREERTRLGTTGCIDPRIFPSRAVPVLDYSFYSFRRGDRESRLAGLQGFAADPVARIGVIGRDNRIVFSVPVEDNVYSAGKKGIAAARGLVAFGRHGKVLWVQCMAMRSAPARPFPHGGCGRYRNSPPPKLPSAPQPRPPNPPGGPLVEQHGEGDGVSLVVRGPKVDADLSGISSTTARLLRSKRNHVTFTCFKLVNVSGKEYSSGVGLPREYGRVIDARFGDALPSRSFSAPFDGCTLAGQYGHTWNDAHGTHDAVEVPLTARGRRYFVERSVARDIAWLARARVFHDFRYAHAPISPRPVARALGRHVVALNNAGSTPPPGRLGIWAGDHLRIVLAERTSTGRRLHLELRDGIIYRTNLIGLTQVL